MYTWSVKLHSVFFQDFSNIYLNLERIFWLYHMHIISFIHLLLHSFIHSSIHSFTNQHNGTLLPGAVHISPVTLSLQRSVHYLHLPSIPDTVSWLMVSVFCTRTASWVQFKSVRCCFNPSHSVSYQKNNNYTFHNTFTIHHPSHMHYQSTDYTEIPKNINIVLYHFLLMRVI